MYLRQNEPNIKQTNRTNSTRAGQLGGKMPKGIKVCKGSSSIWKEGTYT